MRLLHDVLTRAWALRPTAVDPAPLGHTNASFRVTRDAERFVLRRAWEGKPHTHVAREEALLEHLRAAAPDLPVPRLVPTLHGGLHTVSGGRVYHLFRFLPGEAPCSWRGPCSATRAAVALGALARLHVALAVFEFTAAPAGETTTGDEVCDLERRLDALDADGPWLAAQPLGDVVKRALPRFRDGVRALAAEVRRAPWSSRTSQWVHGDLQPENLLFDGDRLTGLLDFDGARRAPCALDLAFALFAVARDGHAEDRFAFDPAPWDAGLASYEGVRAVDAPVRELRPLWRRLYCADQALAHLEAARRGSWALEPGIGFVPCLREFAP